MIWPAWVFKLIYLLVLCLVIVLILGFVSYMTKFSHQALKSATLLHDKSRTSYSYISIDIVGSTSCAMP